MSPKKKPESRQQKIHRQHLVREWEQSWNHYRHLESHRTQYIGFFFTILIGSVGIVLTLGRGVQSAEEPFMIMGLLLLTAVLFLLTTSLLTSIIKTGYVLRRYERIMQTVRKEMGFESSDRLPFDLRDMEGFPEVLEARMFSVQVIAEWLFKGAAILFAVILVLGSITMIQTSEQFPRPAPFIGVGAALAAVLYLGLVFRNCARVRNGRVNEDDAPRVAPPSDAHERSRLRVRKTPPSPPRRPRRAHRW